MLSEWPRFEESLTTAESGRPEPYIAAFLERATSTLGIPRAEVKVLDVGCGRGDRVAWLLQEGWDAYGADVGQAYLEQGLGYLAKSGFGNDRLRLIEDYRLPFAREAPFDVILSYQVLEHVPDIAAFAQGIAVVGRIGTQGLHVCPGRLRPIEPHMKAPFVHWFPKGPSRRLAIRAALVLGLTNDHFADRTLDERTELFNRFSEDETFYRTFRDLSSAFAQSGQRATVDSATADKLRMRFRRVPAGFATRLGRIYGTMWACYMETEQMSVAPRPGRVLQRSS
jgi:SAM-dependent methyltransferase